jgi:hypothetical protein
MTEAVEITTFRLAPGRSVDEFIVANTDINAWLKRQPGFRSRRITELDDGSIADILVWASAAEGSDAAGRIMREMGQSPVHAAIDQGTVNWQIATVRQKTGSRPRLTV